MANKISVERKKEIVAAWLRKGDMKPSDFYKKYKTNNRSVGRWLELYGATMQGVKCAPEPETSFNTDFNLHSLNGFIAIHRGYDSVNVSRSDNPELYEQCLDLWKVGDHQGAWDILDIKNRIMQASEGDVQFEGDKLLYLGVEITGGFVDRVIKAAVKGEEEEMHRWMRYGGLILQHHDGEIIDDLYDFIQANELSVSDDGYIIAYKGCNESGWDWKTGKTFFHQTGNILKMQRSRVAVNRSVACGQGIHFGSLEYARSFGSRLFKVRVKPTDVCSIPYDGKGHKGRCCELEILEEVK